MPETPQQFYDRVSTAIAADGYRESDLAQWKSWPFDGDLTVRPLDPPEPVEPPRHGAGGVGCHVCAPDNPLIVWRDDLFLLGLPLEPTALPFTAFLMSRRHADLADLTDAEGARMGIVMVHLERAVCAVLDVPRVQVLRWGDGSEHLHWWVMARPTGMLQLRGTFLSHWDDLLPPVPREQLRSDAEMVAVDLVARVGGEVVRTPGGR